MVARRCFQRGRGALGHLGLKTGRAEETRGGWTLGTGTEMVKGGSWVGETDTVRGRWVGWGQGRGTEQVKEGGCAQGKGRGFYWMARPRQERLLPR